jgi:hypothetical protein
MKDRGQHGVVGFVVLRHGTIFATVETLFHPIVVMVQRLGGTVHKHAYRHTTRKQHGKICHVVKFRAVGIFAQLAIAVIVTHQRQKENPNVLTANVKPSKFFRAPRLPKTELCFGSNRVVDAPQGKPKQSTKTN